MGSSYPKKPNKLTKKFFDFYKMLMTFIKPIRARDFSTLDFIPGH